MKDARQLSPAPIRIPEELKLYLKHAAVDNRRSFNSEVLLRLEESRRREQGAAPRAAQQQ